MVLSFELFPKIDILLWNW